MDIVEGSIWYAANELPASRWRTALTAQLPAKVRHIPGAKYFLGSRACCLVGRSNATAKAPAERHFLDYMYMIA